MWVSKLDPCLRPRHEGREKWPSPLLEMRRLAILTPTSIEAQRSRNLIMPRANPCLHSSRGGREARPSPPFEVRKSGIPTPTFARGLKGRDRLRPSHGGWEAWPLPSLKTNWSKSPTLASFEVWRSEISILSNQCASLNNTRGGSVMDHH